jgi:hypothetical protein
MHAVVMLTKAWEGGGAAACVVCYVLNPVLPVCCVLHPVLPGCCVLDPVLPGCCVLNSATCCHPPGASDDIRHAKNTLYSRMTWDPERGVSMTVPLQQLSNPAYIAASPPMSPKPHGGCSACTCLAAPVGPCSSTALASSCLAGPAVGPSANPAAISTITHTVMPHTQHPPPIPAHPPRCPLPPGSLCVSGQATPTRDPFARSTEPSPRQSCSGAEAAAGGQQQGEAAPAAPADMPPTEGHPSLRIHSSPYHSGRR